MQHIAIRINETIFLNQIKGFWKKKLRFFGYTFEFAFELFETVLGRFLSTRFGSRTPVIDVYFESHNVGHSVLSLGENIFASKIKFSFLNSTGMKTDFIFTD